MTGRDPKIVVVRLCLFRQFIKVVQQVTIFAQEVIGHQVDTQSVAWKVNILVSNFQRVWNTYGHNVSEFLRFKDDPVWMPFDVGQNVVNRIRITCHSFVSSFLSNASPIVAKNGAFVSKQCLFSEVTLTGAVIQTTI